MCGAARYGIVARVKDVRDEQSVKIRVELTLDGATPVGVATRADGTERDFTGWMGLMSAVDALVADEGRS